MAKKNIYKVVVIGCGRMGVEVGNYSARIQPATHSGAWEITKGAVLAAFVDPDEERLKVARKNFPDVPTFTDMDKMYREIEPDIVSVATPTTQHSRVVLRAIKQPGVQAILCEKPLSGSVKKAKDLVDRALEKNILLITNHQRHFDTLHTVWSEKVQKGFIGEVLQGNIYYYNGLYNNGTHFIDLACLYVGGVSHVSANWNMNTSWNPEDKNLDGILTMKNGAVMTLQSLSKNYGYFNVKMLGEKGMLDISNLGFTIEHRKKIANKDYKGFYELSSSVHKVGEPRSMIKETSKHVIDCLTKKTSPRGTGAEALEVLKVLESLEKSANKNGSVEYIK